MKEDKQLLALAKAIAYHHHVVVFTGAGISTESGIPDYRGPNGLWHKQRPIPLNQFLDDEDRRRDYWRQKKESFETYKTATPNSGHQFLRALEIQGKLEGLITQNVDGLHRISGIDEKKLVELHGTDRKITCLKCGKEFPLEPIFEKVTDAKFESPKCDADSCDGFLKPATISFGQALKEEALNRAGTLAKSADMFLVIGSSLNVQPAAMFPLIAKKNRAYLAILNRDTTVLDSKANLVVNREIGESLNHVSAMLGLLVCP